MSCGGTVWMIWAASRWWIAFLHRCLLIRGHRGERDESLVTRGLHDSLPSRQGDNVPLKREWRTGRGRSRENVFSTLEKAMDWKSKSFSRCERLQDSKLSITHHVSLAVYPFQDLGLERGCSSGCLGRALSETGIDSASLCEFQWRPQGKSPSHEVR